MKKRLEIKRAGDQQFLLDANSGGYSLHTEKNPFDRRLVKDWKRDGLIYSGTDLTFKEYYKEIKID